MKNQIKIITVYDNIECHKDFKSDWGYGCVIDHPLGRILFDTGAKPEILQANLKAASILPESITTVVISHKHWDHKGGAAWILEQNPNINLYIPRTFSKKLGKTLSLYNKNIVSVKNSFSINEHFDLIVSENLWIRELALIIKTTQGALVITGCSHTGIHKILSRASEFTGLEIQAVLGGFHLFRSSEKSIVNLSNSLKQLNVKNIAPCHCTGQKAENILKGAFSTNFLTNGVGAEFTFKL